MIQTSFCDRAPRWVVLLNSLSDKQRSVYAAILMAGRPITVSEVADLLSISVGEASKRVTGMGLTIDRDRDGRTVTIDLPA